MINNISFSGACGLYSYFLGIGSVLQDNFNFEEINFYSRSASSWIPLLLILNINIKDFFYNQNQYLLEVLSNSPTNVYFNFLPLLKKITLESLKDNDFMTINNRLTISLTHIPSFQNYKFNSFKSNEDLLDCMISSGNIPIYNNKLSIFRNKYYIDGAISDKKIYPPDTLKINIDQFRKFNKLDYLITSDIQKHEQLFNLGIIDCKNNLSYFKDLQKL